MKQSNLSQKSNPENKSPDQNSERCLSAIKDEDYSATFPNVESWLYKANTELENQKNERKLKKMKKYFLANKLRFAYPVIALALIIAACSMPVTQKETVGNMMTWTVDKSNTSAISDIQNINWGSNSQLSVSENTDNGKAQNIYNLMLPDGSPDKIEYYRKQIEAINGVTSLKVYPLQGDVKRPLYSAALYKFFRVNINGTGMSDQELQQEITKDLKEQGADNMNVKVSTNSEGRRDLKIELTGDHKSDDSKSVEVNVNDGNNKEDLKIIQKKSDPGKFKGKTDDEIRKMVKEDLNNPEITDDNIKISRDSNGDVQVRVQVEKESNGK